MVCLGLTCLKAQLLFWRSLLAQPILPCGASKGSVRVLCTNDMNDMSSGFVIHVFREGLPGPSLQWFQSVVQQFRGHAAAGTVLCSNTSGPTILSSTRADVLLHSNTSKHTPFFALHVKHRDSRSPALARLHLTFSWTKQGCLDGGDCLPL